MRLAARTRFFAPSAVREILKVAEQPEVRSFAGGLPAPEAFPADALADAHARVLARAPSAALQYSTSEGFGPLRDWVAHRLSREGAATAADDVVITSGSQQGIDLVARVLLDPGAVVVTEDPTYLAALQVFRAAEAQVLGVASDEEGMRLEALAQVLATRPVRLIYVVPTFANPTGTTWSRARRAGLLALAQAWGVPILEDDPYSALRFSGTAQPSLASLDTDGLVVSLGTFSKLLAPGLRLGWARVPEALRRPFVIARQASDLHSSTLSQRVLVDLFEHFDLEAHLERLRTLYSARARAMGAALDSFPSGTRFRTPDGGLFFWVELPEDLDATALLPSAVTRHRVAYVPGAPFFLTAPKRNALRLNFSNCSPVDIDDGVRRLGRFFDEARYGGSTGPAWSGPNGA